MRQELTVVVPRQANEPIGLNITGGRELEAGAIFVHSTRDKGPCSGLLLDHDVIVSINGKMLGESAKRSDAVEIVEASKGDLTFIVLREPRSGMLIKQGMKNKNWKKRLFVISDRELSYYRPDQTSKEAVLGGKQSDKGTPLGRIQLDQVSTIEDFSVSSKKDLYGFQLVTPSRTYYLFAETSKDKKLWIEALQPLVGLNADTGSGATNTGGTAGPSPAFDDDDEDDDDTVFHDPGTADGDENSGPAGTEENALAQRAEAVSPVAAPAGSGSGYTGFMLKSSPDFKSWKRRFFILKDMELNYYKTNDTKGKPQGTVSLGPGCAVEAYEGPLAKGNAHTFVVTVVGGRQYVCSCSNDAERDEWVVQIKNELAQVGA